MKDSFLLTIRALVRGRMLPLLMAGVALVHWLMPSIVRSDGSAEGTLEMFIRAVPGSSATMVMLVLLVTACGMFAREREEKRLALAMVRPVGAFSVVLGRWLALVFASALALAFSAALALMFPEAGDAGKVTYPPCRHHYAPSLPPPSTVAAHLLEDYLKDPKTPEAVKKASKRAVLTLLTTKEIDRYDVIPPGETMIWPYDIEGLTEKMAAGERLALKVRFSTQFELRSPVAGEIAIGGYSAVVSNNTQSLIEIPLMGAGVAPKAGVRGKVEDGKVALTFKNTGKSAVMIRPRRDLEVLAMADSFGMNLLRAELEVWAMASLLAAFGLLLSAALSRPVAVFTALVAYAIVLMAPSVIAQFPDEFNAPVADRLGLALSRGIQAVTSSLAEPTPMADLATSRAVEWSALGRILVMDVILLPLALLMVAGMVIRRKPQD